MSAPADLAPEAILRRLRTARFGRSLTVLAETESTMDDAREAASHGAVDGHLVLADAQRSGRGSHGRPWLSPKGTDLYFSIVTRPKLEPAHLPPLTLAVGLGVAEAAERLTGARAEVKWPNDVLLGGAKCAGVLVESRASGESLDTVILGVGLNVNRRDFPEGLEVQATSLALARGGSSIDRVEALAVVLERIESWVDRFVAEGAASVVAALTSRLAFIGREASCGGVTGVVDGIDPDGALRLLTPDGPRRSLSGRLHAR